MGYQTANQKSFTTTKSRGIFELLEFRVDLMPVAFGEKIVVFCALYLPHFHRACVEPRLLQPLLFHYLDNEHTSINDLRI